MSMTFVSIEGAVPSLEEPSGVALAILEDPKVVGMLKINKSSDLSVEASGEQSKLIAKYLKRWQPPKNWCGHKLEFIEFFENCEGFYAF